MGSRLELHELLIAITPRVYFQPPPTIQLQYPCIIYRRDDTKIDYADDVKYKHHIRYQVTVVAKDPDSTIGPAVEQFDYCEFTRFYTADTLNHDVYNLFF